MKDQRKSEIKVGITVLIGTILFIWILTWAKNFTLTSSDRVVKVEFENVSGLEIGDQVTINGVKKGHVDDIQVHENKVLVNLAIEKDAILRSDAVFRVAMLDLMGGKKVEIFPGISEDLLDFSKIHTGSFTADIATVMSLIGHVQDDINSSIKDMKITLTAINNYLTDKELSDNIKSSINNLSNASSKINLMIDENTENLKKLISNSTELSEEAKSFLIKNKEELNNSFQEMRKLLEQTNNLITKANEFADEIKNQKNNLGKFLYDENFFGGLSETINKLNELSKLILEQLKGDGFKVDANVDLF